MNKEEFLKVFEEDHPALDRRALARASARRAGEAALLYAGMTLASFEDEAPHEITISLDTSLSFIAIEGPVRMETKCGTNILIWNSKGPDGETKVRNIGDFLFLSGRYHGVIDEKIDDRLKGFSVEKAWEGLEKHGQHILALNSDERDRFIYRPVRALAGYAKIDFVVFVLAIGGLLNRLANMKKRNAMISRVWSGNCDLAGRPLGDFTIAIGPSGVEELFANEKTEGEKSVFDPQKPETGAGHAEFLETKTIVETVESFNKDNDGIYRLERAEATGKPS